jgi:hypothetical protein
MSSTNSIICWSSSAVSPSRDFGPQEAPLEPIPHIYLKNHLAESKSSPRLAWSKNLQVLAIFRPDRRGESSAKYILHT